jgi:hypothetical protein
MTNNGKFIHNVDAGVGTAVQKMHQNGEYRCKVDEQTKLDDAFKQWTACSVIEMVNTASYVYDLGSYGTDATLDIKHNNKYIDFEISGPSTFDNPFDAAYVQGDNKVINIGNLKVTSGGLDITFVKGTANNKVGRRTLNVNGNMTVAANCNIFNSLKVTVSGNLTLDGAAVSLYYAGGDTWGALSNSALTVAGNITVNGGYFNASDVDALNITCANFSLKKKGSSGAVAEFGNRTNGGYKNLVVSGTINNPSGCTFGILAANQNSAGSVLAWVTCSELKVGGNFPGSKPRVE